MARSQKLNAALEVLDFKLNKQLSALVELMQFKIENDKKLHDLISYQDGYKSAKENQTITSIQIHYNLMGKLQLAIDSQSKIVQDLEYKVNERIVTLRKDQAQNRALSVLVKRYHKQELDIKEKEEQKELDSQILSLLNYETT
jgi:flagellar biosynthesis chaperone FliJ